MTTARDIMHVRVMTCIGEHDAVSAAAHSSSNALLQAAIRTPPSSWWPRPAHLATRNAPCFALRSSRRRWTCSASLPMTWFWPHRGPSRRRRTARSGGPPAGRSMRLAGSVSDRGRCGGSWLASGSVERRHRCAAHANRGPAIRS